MKKQLIYIALLMISTMSFAQWSAGMSVGLSAPQGTYQDTDIDDGGYALNGATFNLLELQYNGKTFGGSMLWGGAAHDIDLEALSSDMGMTVSTNDLMSVGYFLVGVSAGGSDNQSSYRAHIRYGSMYYSIPSLSAGNVKTEAIESDSGNALSLGAEYAYALADHWSIFGGLDYIMGTVSADGSDQDIDILNMKVGLKYVFGK